MLDLIASLLSLFTLPVALICVIDDWFIRPKRQLRLVGGEPARDPFVMRVLYWVLPFTVIAVFFQLMSAQRADFSLVLIVITAISGVVWAIDHWLLRPGREAAGRAVGRFLVGRHVTAGQDDALRAETSVLGLKVHTIYPGSIRTDVSRNALTADGSARGASDSVIDNGIDPLVAAKWMVDAMLADEREIIVAEGGEAKMGELRRTPDALFDQVAAMMAAGYAAASGHLGVALVGRGPAMANAVHASMSASRCCTSAIRCGSVAVSASASREARSVSACRTVSSSEVAEEGTSCATPPIRTRAGSVISPPSSASSPRIRRNSVDFPVPLRPTSPTLWP